MQWIAPSEKDTANQTLEKRLWEAADQLRANSGLTSAQYSTPVLGLIFLRFAEARFAKRRAQLEKSTTSSRRGPSRIDDPGAYHAEGVIYLTPNARYEHLLGLPEGTNVGQAINEAMADIEKHNPQLAGVLPRTYQIFNSTLLKELLKKVSEIPESLEYDAFGRIYEYFLGEFARTRRAERWRVLHAECDRQTDCRDHRTLPRALARSSLRLRRHVRAKRAIRTGAQEKSIVRTRHPRSGEGWRHRSAVPHEPRRPRTRRRYPRGKLVL